MNEIRGICFSDSIISGKIGGIYFCDANASENLCGIYFRDWLQIGKYKVAEFNFVFSVYIKYRNTLLIHVLFGWH